MITVLPKLSVFINTYPTERKIMLAKFLIASFIFFLQYETITCQRQWVLPTTTASEMRNPYTWYWPYAIAASEAYRDYFVNAQKITNQLHQQAEATNAFPWASNTASGAADQAMNNVPGGNWNGPYSRFRTWNRF